MFIKARNPKKQTNTTGVKTNKGVAVHLWIFIVGVATAHHVCVCPGQLVERRLFIMQLYNYAQDEVMS